MSFVRPEAMAALTRWRELIIGVVIVLLGLNWAIGARGILQWIGPVVLIAGAAIAWLGWQRGRFRGAEEGRGAVDVDEGQITYLGPLSGGSVSLREVHRLILDGQSYPAHWRLDQAGQPPLMIPIDAVGAHHLFDAFASLPGMRMDVLLAAREQPKAAQTVVWERAGTAARGAIGTAV